MRLLFTGLLLLSSLWSCTKDKQTILFVRPAGCDSSLVSYSRQIRPIILNNCAFSGCHVAGGEGAYDYRTYGYWPTASGAVDCCSDFGWIRKTR